MAATCLQCGAALPEGPAAHCPACGVENPAAAAEPDPAAARPVAPPPPRLPGSMVVLAPALACAWFGSLVAGGGLSFTPPNPGMLVGGLIGLLIGAAVWFDDRSFQRRLAGQAEPLPAKLRPPAEWIAVLMLVLPLIAGVLIWQRDALRLPARVVALLGYGTIVATALLGYADTRQLAASLPGGRPEKGPPANPVGTFFAILVLWMLGYPVHFVARRLLGGKGFFALGLLSTAVFLAPTIGQWLSGPDVPGVGVPEVLAAVKQTLEDSPLYRTNREQIGPLTLSDPEEISFDREKQRRVGRVQVTSNLGEQPVFYVIEWQDRGKRLFQIRVSDRQP
jgi:hypothetical protein